MWLCELGWVQQSYLKLVESNKLIFVDAYNKSRWFSTISGNTREKLLFQFAIADSRCLFWLFEFAVADSRYVYFAFFCCMRFRKEHYRIYVHCVERKEMKISHLSYSGSNVSLHCDFNFSIAMYLAYKIDVLSYNNQICAMFICAPHVYFASVELQECFFSIKFLSIQMPFTFIQ
ncbi:hypothetical protein AMTRI_Chr12g270860 [Amborella trichopoda]